MKENISLFKKIDTDIVFMSDGRSDIIFTKNKDTAINNTRVLLISGLNHFITYVFEKCDISEYKYLVNYILSTRYEIITEHSKFKDDIKYPEKLTELLCNKCCISDEKIIDLIMKYTVAVSNETLDHTKAKTLTTLTNDTTLVIQALATMVKISYVFSALIRGTWSYTQTLGFYVDILCKHAFDGFVRYKINNTNEYISSETMTSNFDDFMFRLVGKIWDDTFITKSYSDKFHSVGINKTLNTNKNKVDILSSLKKYTPVPETEEIGRKYSESDPMSVYWTIDKNFDDFKFNANNTTKWIQVTMSNVIKRQDSRKSFAQDINVVSILQSYNDESSLRRESSLYEDKEGHLLEIRKESAKTLFNYTIDELNKYSFEIQDTLKSFNAGKSHPFNQYVLSKIYLALTGEHRVYKEVMGNFNKTFLVLFYIKIKLNKEFSFIHDDLDIMRCVGKPNTDLYSVATIEEFLKQRKLHLNPAIVKNILGAYTTESGDIYTLTLEMFYKLFKKLEDAAYIRHLLYPSIYKADVKVQPGIETYINKPIEFANMIKEHVLEGLYD